MGTRKGRCRRRKDAKSPLQNVSTLGTDEAEATPGPQPGGHPLQAGGHGLRSADLPSDVPSGGVEPPTCGLGNRRSIL